MNRRRSFLAAASAFLAAPAAAFASARKSAPADRVMLSIRMERATWSDFKFSRDPDGSHVCAFIEIDGQRFGFSTPADRASGLGPVALERREDGWHCV